jgi:enoyl-CoA hydratase/carnithine racemase
MEKMAEVLRIADKALSSAYTAKAGMSEEEALAMMENETWLTAEQAKEKGLIDAIMFEEQKKELPLVAGPLFALPSEEQMEKAKNMMKEAESQNKTDSVFLIQQQLNLLKLRGEKR